MHEILEIVETVGWKVSQKSQLSHVVFSVETALNSSGDVFFTATAEEFDRKKNCATTSSAERK